MIGEAPHLLDPEVLDCTPVPDGKQRGLYYIPSSQGRSPDSAAEFVDSIFEVALRTCPVPVMMQSVSPVCATDARQDREQVMTDDGTNFVVLSPAP